MSQENEKDTELNVEKEIEVKASEDSLTSFDLLWKQSLQELDAWSERACYREQVLLNSTKHLVENLKRNQTNMKDFIEQFVKEQRDWEKVAREELLTSTSHLQYLFPIQSFEEINRFVDNFQVKATEISNIPVYSLSNAEVLERFVQSVEQFVEFRKNSRIQFIENLKVTLKIIHENQRGMVQLFTKQVKNVLFPFNMYMERSEQLSKS
ncbi:hypothetical protein [Alkalihalobacterium alkalinitrilicum]|uniref:hypothetical protein n=1 Tax=Alkalihalobacterium alkalinitrilicum TaxID=427920 RepID=UPI000994DFA1|nr:hypothetical protein [Alkalihalobacterium alkalinitrilicum]